MYTKPFPAPLLAGLVALLLASCQVANRVHQFQYPAEVPAHEITNAFIDAAEAHYAGRGGGQLAPPEIGASSTILEFDYDRLAENGSSGERLHLRSLTSRARIKVGTIERLGPRQHFLSLTATYNVEGPNPEIPGLADEIIAAIQARMQGSADSPDSEAPAPAPGGEEVAED